MRTICPTYADWQVPVTYRAVTAAKNARESGLEHRQVTAHGSDTVPDTNGSETMAAKTPNGEGREPAN